MRAALLTLLTLSLCGTILFSGCRTKPPEQERLLAEKAFKDAALGKDCDRENYIAAEELLAKAREEVNAKKYENAKKLFAAVKEKADSVVEYVRSHPDECTPGEKKSDASMAGNGRKEDSVEEVSIPTKDPRMTFPVIHFEYNEYAIRAEDISLVRQMAEWMQNFPDAAIRIEGHADERGSIDYNMSLGERRAQEVRDELVKNGIDKNRLKVISYGEERPVAEGHDDAAWFQNRRAEFVRTN